jgi:hypothetical protein
MTLCEIINNPAKITKLIDLSAFVSMLFIIGAGVKKCDFDCQFLSFSYLFFFAQNNPKDMSLNAHLHGYVKITFIHRKFLV